MDSMELHLCLTLYPDRQQGMQELMQLLQAHILSKLRMHVRAGIVCEVQQT